VRTSVRIGQWNAGFGSRLTRASTLSLGNRSTRAIMDYNKILREQNEEEPQQYSRYTRLSRL
jgi:hypothetical protein